MSHARRCSKMLINSIITDVKAKARWRYQDAGWKSMLKTLAADGTSAMIFYRLMQWAHRYRIVPLAMVFNKLNAVMCNCIIGRGAEFGPGFALLHSTGTVINAQVRGGQNIYLEHQVTIGAEGRQAPSLGNDIFVGAGAKIIGSVTIGDGARIGANAVVVHDVPPHCTVVGIPARIVRRRDPQAVPSDAIADEGRPVG